MHRVEVWVSGFRAGTRTWRDASGEQAACAGRRLAAARCRSPRPANGRSRATSRARPVRDCWRAARACGPTSSTMITARSGARSESPTARKCLRSPRSTAASCTPKGRPTKTVRTSSPPPWATHRRPPTGASTGTRWRTPMCRSPSGRLRPARRRPLPEKNGRPTRSSARLASSTRWSSPHSTRNCSKSPQASRSRAPN
jgi:hypothetical protein